MLNTTENIDADMQAIADFYEPIMGKYPNNFNPDITGTKKLFKAGLLTQQTWGGNLFALLA